MEKLPIEFKEKWVAALRSGKYQQGTGTLVYDDTYCCLGVACVIAGVDEDDMGGDLITEKIGKRYSIPSVLVGDVVDGPDANPVVVKLTSMNDGTEYWDTGLSKAIKVPGKSFVEIAQYIEDNL